MVITCLKKLETVSVIGLKLSNPDPYSSDDQLFRLSNPGLPRSEEPLLIDSMSSREALFLKLSYCAACAAYFRSTRKHP